MTLIQTEQLTKTYRTDGVPIQALRGVDLKVERDEFTAVAGPSGSGKTTLLNLIGALDVPTSGKIFFDRQNLLQLPKNALAELRLRKIGFIFQAYNLIPVLTALENVEFVMMLQGVEENERRKRAMAILEELGIAEYAHTRPNLMSGGQQQRVAIARAIVSNPLLILADEPTANLDSKTGEGLMDLMSKMNQEKGVTFIFSTHDKMVMDRARRLILLRDGQVAEDQK